MIDKMDLGFVRKFLGRGERRSMNPLAMVSLFSSLGVVFVGVSLLVIGVDGFTQMLAAMTESI